MNSNPFLMKLSSKLILGSGSPRRKQLLQDAGFDFEVITIDYNEVFPDELNAHEVEEYLAKQKNALQRKHLSDEIVLTADTVVIHENKVLGKPENGEEALQTIKSLSNQVHDVVTGVCISNRQNSISFSSVTAVKFKELTQHEIEYYVAQFKPFDKAGSYAIQEWIGLIGVEWIRGSFYNVVGLPVSEVYTSLLREF